MKKASYLTAALGVGGLFLIGSLMESRESKVRGAYSSPVSVMNTTAAPAVTSDIEFASRIPYQSTQSATCGPPQCILNFSTPPAGKRLFVEHISGVAYVPAGTTVPLNGVLSNGTATWGFSSVVGQPFAGVDVVTVNQPLLATFESGVQPSGSWVGNFSTMFPVTLTLTGYLQNCAVETCPAVQN